MTMARAHRRTKEEIAAERDADLDALAEAQVAAHRAGRLDLAPVAGIPYPVIDLRALRATLGLTQKAFADRFGFSLGAVRNWEQGRRLPDRSARILLRLIEHDPDTAAKLAQEI